MIARRTIQRLTQQVPTDRSYTFTLTQHALRTGLQQILIIIALIHAYPALAQSSYETSLASKIVSEGVNVKTGEFVAIFGGSRSTSLANAIATECTRLKAVPVMLTTTDSLEYLRLSDTVKFAPRYVSRISNILKECRVIIVLTPYLDDPVAMKRLLPTVNRRDYENQINKMINVPGVRVIYVNQALPSISDYLKVDHSEYELMVQKSNLVDNDVLMQNVNRLNGFLRGAKKIKITDAFGSNVIFSIENQSIVIDDGRITTQEAQKTIPNDRKVSLPSGTLKINVKQSSGIGRIVIPQMECNYDPVKNVTLIINKGIVEQLETSSSCLTELMKVPSKARQIESISFQFNWELKFTDVEGIRFWRNEGGGLIWITTGVSKTLANGSNATRQFSFPIVATTVEVDDKVVLKTGY